MTALDTPDGTPDLDGDTALVAASSSGLGKAAATSLAAAGANVVLNGRDEARLDAAVADVDAVGPGDAVGHAADITDADAVAGLVDAAAERFGGVDHLVLNAGDPASGGLGDVGDDDWYEAFDLLVMSAVRLVRAARPHLLDGGGSVVAITSITVRQPVPDLVLSSSVRMAVLGFVKTLSRSLAPDVRANAVLPGPVETPALRDIVEAAVERGEHETYEAGLASYWPDDVPTGGVAQPEELGDVVAFLASPAASYVNGASLLVDGGIVRAV
ncbi:SDR family oxidoreductase [Halobacterium yunchengense]|uniref:SDR family oxidoreductase n=1 Tax=Halobacterium yunchengense TaxID=3108497 RepID=UPI00300A6459